MKALIQRVTKAEVLVGGKPTGVIGLGLLALLGVEVGDTAKEADWLAEKLVTLRIFSDAESHLNLSLLDVEGSILLVSQFTLLGDCRKGRRPSFSRAAHPKLAEELYRYLGQRLSDSVPVSYGQFGAHMSINLVNDGPVTFMLEKSPESPPTEKP
ncbi:MAG: D-tyrosyl-tRNA(Tyr) deacylase [Deltaproteobacteria bacterium]|jgi:D-tyrosyl-tRNA(Tyr) deacylase|nr:D-tyrosyl-tRNA(Tyr) deacylase [Deltaproteobacteria bacterium]